MPPHRGHKEDGEEDDLHKQPAEHDLLAEVDLVRGAAGHHPAAAGLQEEAEDVAGDEDLGEPGDADGREVLGAEHAREPPQDHVDGGCVERRRDQEEERLHHVRLELGRGVVGEDAADVASLPLGGVRLGQRGGEGGGTDVSDEKGNEIPGPRAQELESMVEGGEGEEDGEDGGGDSKTVRIGRIGSEVLTTARLIVPSW